MKSILSLFVVYILASNSILNAQITMTQGDAPLAGESWIEFLDDRSGVHSIGPAGMNQTWDYSTNFVVQDTDYVSFVSPSTLMPPLNTYFPTSNLAFEDPLDSSVTYLKIISNGIFADGSYLYANSGPVGTIDFDPDLLFVPFPFTYNDMRSHTSKFELVEYDSTINATLMLKFYNVSNFFADGYGSLTTPHSTVSNVLRIRNLTRSVDSVFIDTVGIGNFMFLSTSGFDTSISYQHLQNGDPAIVFTLEVEADDATVEEAYYATVLTTGIQQAEPSNSTKVYPNPALDDVIHIQIQHKNANLLKIYDLNGKEVYTTNVKNVQDLKLQLNLVAGTYLYKLFSLSGDMLDSGRFIKGK
ncbi:MAG: T9SS type A sorting domain-containing protein [Bacteroidia bacterium]|nr:T9SS type A sorting domain-containing protein [Bacteroidia bacterium]